jgi:hypothetical protein
VRGQRRRRRGWPGAGEAAARLAGDQHEPILCQHFPDPRGHAPVQDDVDARSPGMALNEVPPQAVPCPRHGDQTALNPTYLLYEVANRRFSATGSATTRPTARRAGQRLTRLYL